MNESRPGKFLCVCQYGHSRSVALARDLHGRNLPAVAIGFGTSGDAVYPLSEWADYILLMDMGALNWVPTKHRGKVRDLSVGPDRWSNPYNPNLAQIVHERVDRLFQIEGIAN